MGFITLLKLLSESVCMRICTVCMCVCLQLIVGLEFKSPCIPGILLEQHYWLPPIIKVSRYSVYAYKMPTAVGLLLAGVIDHPVCGQGLLVWDTSG